MRGDNLKQWIKENGTWNQGLTKENNESMKIISEKLKGNKNCLGRKLSEKTKRKIGLGNSISLKGNIPWNKGKKGLQVAWNKGLKTKLSSKIKISLNKSNDDKFVTFKNSFIKRLRMNNRYLTWRSNVFKRDNYTCQNCGEKGCYIEAHHIVPFGKMIVLFEINTIDKAIKCKALWDEGNGITYCRNCHIKLDENIGKGLMEARRTS